MPKNTSKAFEWIKQIPSVLVNLDSIPQLGSPPSFPWDDLVKNVSSALEVENLKIEPTDFEWRDEKELFSQLGGPLLPLAFAVSPFEGKLFFAISEDDIKDLMAFLLFKEADSKHLIDAEYVGGFLHFFALEAIHQLANVNYDSEIAPKLLKNGQLPSSPMFSQDLVIILDHKRVLCRLFFSPELRQSIASHYAKKGRDALFDSPLAEKLQVSVHLEAGSTTLSQQEWSQIKPGDFLVLDRCSLDSTGKGTIMINLEGYPLFKGKIKNGNIEILEHPKHQEEA